MKEECVQKHEKSAALKRKSRYPALSRRVNQSISAEYLNVKAAKSKMSNLKFSVLDQTLANLVNLASRQHYPGNQAKDRGSILSQQSGWPGNNLRFSTSLKPTAYR